MLEMPVFEYIGDEYQHGLLEKVAIDWSKQFIRGSLKVKPENNHPDIKKEEHRLVVLFAFGDVGTTLRHLTPPALDKGTRPDVPSPS